MVMQSMCSMKRNYIYDGSNWNECSFYSSTIVKKEKMKSFKLIAIIFLSLRLTILDSISTYVVN